MAIFTPRVTWPQMHRIHAGMQRVHRFGIRTTSELGIDLARQTDPEIVLAVLEQYAGLTPESIVAAGADRLVPRCLALVP
jgi:hypothetical protein